MATVYRRVNGKKIERYIADQKEVQVYLGERAWIIRNRAAVNLQKARDAGKVDPTRGLTGEDLGARIDYGQGYDKALKLRDWWIALDDTASDDAPLSIEFGRADYLVDQYGRTSGGHIGLYILTRAANLPIEKHKRVRPPIRHIVVKMKGR